LAGAKGKGLSLTISRSNRTRYDVRVEQLSSLLANRTVDMMDEHKSRNPCLFSSRCFEVPNETLASLPGIADILGRIDLDDDVVDSSEYLPVFSQYFATPVIVHYSLEVGRYVRCQGKGCAPCAAGQVRMKRHVPGERWLPSMIDQWLEQEERASLPEITYPEDAME
jgi:hypothetical protein